MCGICGKVTLDGKVSEKLIRDMCSVLKHRGPDGEGVYVSDTSGQRHIAQVGLGHRRLSVIDLSQAGKQPMSNEDGSIWIVMNGEIYNFPELREYLKKNGHKFKSKTDTEVIIHLYEERGTECLEELRGAFAFAIWDTRNARLFMARDRIGKKPLYYIHKGNSITFASEIKALLCDPDATREVNRSAIRDYLSYGYVPTPRTMFKGIMKLPPAHMMVYEKGALKIEQYWSLDFSKKVSMSQAEYCDKAMALLKDATRIRLISDVPLGVFLSGGIDSSAIVYMMSKLSTVPVKTFSIGFDDARYNELKYARTVAEHFGTEHREYIVKPKTIELLPKLVWHYNEPYADSSALPSYYVAKMTSQEVKVALNGDGGDEVFGGYERFLAARYAEIFKKMPILLQKGLKTLVVNGIPDSLDFKNRAARLKRFVSMAERPYSERHYNWISIFKDSEKEDLFTNEYKSEMNGSVSLGYLNDAFAKCKTKDVVDCVISADINTNLLDDLLVKMDIATMANSLEGRSPFLDHKLMEFSASIPSGIKIRGMKLKYILKKALSQALPKEILTRPKRGFAVPLDAWFRSDLKEYAYDTLLDPRATGRNYFKKEGIKRLLDSHCDSKANNGSRIWSLLNLELWHRVFVDGEKE